MKMGYRKYGRKTPHPVFGPGLGASRPIFGPVSVFPPKKKWYMVPDWNRIHPVRFHP